MKFKFKLDFDSGYKIKNSCLPLGGVSRLLPHPQILQFHVGNSCKHLSLLGWF